MTRIQRLSILAPALVLGVLLAGCDNFPEKTVENIKQGISGTVAVAGEVSNVVLHDIGDKKENGIRKDLTANEAVGEAAKIKLSNEVGNIEVKPSESDQIIVNATIWASGNSSKLTQYEEIMDQAEVSVIHDGEQLEIAVHPKGDTGKDLWKWAKDSYGFSEFTIDYTLELPESVSSFDISSEVGEIHMSHLKGTYHVLNEVGRIHIEDASIAGNSSVTSEAGSLRLAIQQMDDKSSLKAVTDVGSINAELADTLKCNLMTSTEIGRISGVSKGKSEVNGGGPLLSLETSIGSITIGDQEEQ